MADQGDGLLAAAVAQRPDNSFDAAAGSIDRLQGRVLAEQLFRSASGDISLFVAANRLGDLLPFILLKQSGAEDDADAFLTGKTSSPNDNGYFAFATA